MKPLERLGEARTPNGTLLVLYRHDGAYLIRADGVELMSTRRHLSEDRLAEVACAPLGESAGARVLIGGLGLGFTLRAALRQLRDDVMLDTDNGPDGMLMSENARLYARRGIADTVAALRAGGSIVYWSVGDDPRFVAARRGAGLAVTALQVRAHATAGPMHTLYVAKPRG
jgi:hypothetical protein